jgi:hypothetical protein
VVSKGVRSLARFAFKQMRVGPKSLDDENVAVPVSEPLVVNYLQSLRDNGTKAWQRLQAARAIEMYAAVVVRTCDVKQRLRAKVQLGP